MTITRAVIGALITALQVFGFTVFEPAGYLGIGLTVAVFGTVIIVYSFEGPYLGPGEEFLADLVAMSDDEGEGQFLSQMGEWIDTNRGRLGRMAFWLLVGDVALFVSVLALLYAILL